VGRAAALLAVGVAVGVYYGTVSHLWNASLWWDIAWLGLVVIPAVFALVGLVLPLWRRPVPWLGGAGGVAIAVALLADWAGLHAVANFGKLAAMTFLGFAFLAFFEELSWVVLVALVIPWVDAYSVWRGPTKTIVNNHPSVFSALSISFPAPGLVRVPATSHEPASSYVASVHLGLPDLFFYAIFLGASARFGLRVFPTWICLSLSFGATLALASWWDLNGLPALPLLALGFLLPNLDLIWGRLRNGVRIDLRDRTAPG
jgi:hypothetical protein